MNMTTAVLSQKYKKGCVRDAHGAVQSVGGQDHDGL